MLTIASAHLCTNRDATVPGRDAMCQATREATSAGSIASLCRTVPGQRCAAPPTAYCCRRWRAALFLARLVRSRGTHLSDREVASRTTRARRRLQELVRCDRQGSDPLP